MKTKYIPKLAAALLLLSTINHQLSTLFAQGTAFTYQGRLNDGVNPASGSFDLRFVLFTADPGGSQVGPSLTNSAFAVSNGLFTVSLDFGANNFTNVDRFLEIAVRTNLGGSFNTLSPRQKLTPAPYAIFAGNVGSGGLTAGTYGSAVTFNNANNNLSGTFSGNGASVTNVNAAKLAGLSISNFWQTGGNNVSAGQFLGSTNNQAVEIQVNGQRALLLMTNATDSSSLVGGSPANVIDAGVKGAVIAGGGTTNFSGASSSNRISADYASIGGGSGNWIQAGSDHSVIGNGWNNLITSNAYHSVIAGGQDNVISNSYAFIAGGKGNTALGQYSTAMGNNNSASGNYSTAMGFNTAASGDNSTALGAFSTAAGFASIAMGRNAKAMHAGSFVLADSQAGDFASTGTGQFLIRAAGGVGINKNNPAGALDVAVATGQSLVFRQDSGLVPGINVATTGGNAGVMRLRNSMEIWPSDDATRAGRLDVRNTSGNATISLDGSSGVVTCVSLNQTSDRNAKENFAGVSPAEILAKVSRLPLSEWSYKDDAVTRHIGPMAQDFHAAFDVGTDEKHIAPIDEGGVALAAIQGLNQKLDEKDAEIQTLKQKNDSLAQRLTELEAAVKTFAENK